MLDIEMFLYNLCCPFENLKVLGENSMGASTDGKSSTQERGFIDG